MNSQSSRREFLRLFGRRLSYMPLASVASDLLFSRILTAAQAAPTSNPNNYLHLSFPGGPPRWCFDLPLTPTGKTNANFSQGGFGTRIDMVSGVPQVTYATERFVVGGKTMHLAPVWGMNAGGQDFKSLLPHTAFIRGLDTEINAHGISNGRQVAPIVGGLSISGSMADDSGKPFPALIGHSVASLAFKSKKGLSPSLINYTSSADSNPIFDLLRKFKPDQRSRLFHTPEQGALQQQALREFEKYASKNGISESSLSKMYNNAIAMIEGGSYDLTTSWTEVFTRYKTLVRQGLLATKGQLPGIFDSTIPGQNGSYPFRFGEETYVTLPDVRDMFDEHTHLEMMAENFAVAEIMLGNLTSSMTLDFNSIQDLTSSRTTAGVANRFELPHDQHFTGGVISTIATTFFYRAFLTCLTEFVSRLKIKGIFDKTVIHIGAEFNRRPIADFRGSAHGAEGSNSTLISGLIQTPAIIGNIKVNRITGTTNDGTWGLAANFETPGFENPGRPIQVNDVALTITSMLGVGSVVTNGRSLLVPSGNEWIPLKDEAKNVA